ncbi:hypothetical protein ACWCQQ_48045, partial [Streptomyces sp. NPDC002143]
ENANPEVLERRLTGHLVEQATTAQEPPSPADSGRRERHRPVRPTTLHLALARVAKCEATRGRGVRTLWDLYRPVPRGRLSAALQSAVLAFCAYTYLSDVVAQSYYSEYREDTSTAIIGLFSVALLSYAYLRQEALPDTPRTDRRNPAVPLRGVVRTVPGIICAGLALTPLFRSSEYTDGTLFALPFAVLMVMGSFLALWESTSPARIAVDAMMVSLTAVTALAAALIPPNLPLVIIGLRFALLTTVTGQWARAALPSPKLLPDLDPSDLLTALTHATRTGLVEHTPQGYRLIHPAIARWCLSTHRQPGPDQSPLTDKDRLWRRAE